jgi:hypothetical protein
MIGTWRAATPDPSGAPGRIAGQGRIAARAIVGAAPATIDARGETAGRARTVARTRRSNPDDDATPELVKALPTLEPQQRELLMAELESRRQGEDWCNWNWSRHRAQQALDGLP